jgi:two-component system, chemotaxis family, response regulator Rcp1
MRPDTEVLFVEDDAGDRELVARALSRVGRPRRWAIVGSVAEAKNYLNRASAVTVPHLIVLDLKLPGGDGREFLDYIKCDDALRHIPVVVLSGNLSPATVIDCYSRRANCCIAKPFDGKEFEEVLVAVLKFWSNSIFLPYRDASAELRKTAF